MRYTKFKVICLFVPKKMFEVCFAIYGHGHVTWNFEQNFISHIPGGLHYENWLQSAQRFLKKGILKLLNLSDFGQRTLTLGSHKLSCIHLFDYMYRLLTSQNSSVSTKSTVLAISHTKQK